MRTPFPYYGNKSIVAPLVWELLGDPTVYAEPFAGSAAVLLSRPQPGRYEAIGDADHFVANFWRAVRAEPDAVARAAVRPMVEADVAAIGCWLRDEAREALTSVDCDPAFYDVEIAGRWAWCQATAVGVNQWRRMTSGYKGVNRLYADVPEELRALAARLALVQVYLGDWERTVRAVRWRPGTRGVFLDPPYRRAGRADVYAVEATESLHDRIEAWCLAESATWRIVIAGYDGDFHLDGWRCIEVDASGKPAGQARARDVNQHRERLWTNVPQVTDTLFVP